VAKRTLALRVHPDNDKKAQKPPRSPKASYRLLFEQNPQPMWVTDMDSLAFLAVNAAAMQHYGYSREEFLGMTIRDIRPPEDIPALIEKASKTVEGLENWGVWRHRKKDGTVIDVEVTSYDFQWAGRCARLVSIVDVTESRTAEEKLRRAEESYRLLVEQSPDAILVHRRGSIVFANRSAAALFGTSSPDQLLGKQAIDLVHPDDREIVKQRIQEFSDDFVSVRRSERRYLDLEGREIYTEVAARSIIYQGETAIQLMFRDVSQRKKAEEELRHSEERFHKAFHAMPEPITIATAADGRYMDVNEHFLRVTGYLREEVVGRTSMEIGFWQQSEDRSALLDQLNQSGSVRDYEITFRTKSGEQRTALDSAEVVEIAGKKCILAVFKDITEQRTLEKQLRQAQKMEAIGQLSGGIAHDFNNLLSVIIGYSEALEESLPQDSRLQKNCQQIKKAGQSAASLTRQLLAFSRQQVLEPKVLDLNAVVLNVEKMLCRLIGEHIELATALDPALARVKADQGQIEQVIINLAVNARDAMPNGGKLTVQTANVEVDQDHIRRHPLHPPGSYVLLTVSDTGVGMDAETQARIFEPFFTTKEMGKGTGLGLATVYGVVKQSGGFIWVYSELGHGTTFKIYLPHTSEAPAEDRPAPSGSLRGTETVLLVEDEEALRDFTATALTQNGYTVLTAERPDRAIEIARQHQGPIDLVLTDVIMPGMNGRALAESLAAIRAEIRLVYMSGYTGFTHPELVDSDVILLAKPFTREALLRKVREGLARVTPGPARS
jgi:two-component system, cell cycle sensor histidine kinase and response regulator CckA